MNLAFTFLFNHHCHQWFLAYLFTFAIINYCHLFRLKKIKCVLWLHSWYLGFDVGEELDFYNSDECVDICFLFLKYQSNTYKLYFKKLTMFVFFKKINYGHSNNMQLWVQIYFEVPKELLLTWFFFSLLCKSYCIIAKLGLLSSYRLGASPSCHYRPPCPSFSTSLPLEFTVEQLCREPGWWRWGQTTAMLLLLREGGGIAHYGPRQSCGGHNGAC